MVRVLRKQLSAVAIANVVLIALPVLFLLLQGYRRRWVAEDAFISLRVVDNLLAGFGPVFNVGERVEVYTHPLWVGILTLWGAAGLRLEYGAVVLGLLLSGAGLVAAQAGSLRLLRLLRPGAPETSRDLVLPVGAVVFVSVAVVWDFVTSGLETGLSFAWLGVSYWLLVRCLPANGAAVTGSRVVLAAVVFGLGPLVRPDLGLFAIGFFVVLLAVELAGATRRRVLVDGGLIIVAFGLIPGVYQIMRMGYFASIVPNTALAKEAGMTDWYQGWLYFQDFNQTYLLWIPLGLLGIWWALILGTSLQRDRLGTMVLAVPVICAILHAIYVIRLGGDFMHGRFLLPTLFAFLLPMAAVPVWPSMRVRLLASIALFTPVLVWAIVSATSFAFSAEMLDDDLEISDERGFYVEGTGDPNPITIHDYRALQSGWTDHGFDLRDAAQERPRTLIMEEGTFPLAAESQPDAGLVVVVGNIGVRGYAAGREVFMADLQGLGDPLAGRMSIEKRTRPGHEKQLPAVWFQARFGTADGIPPSPQLDAAREVLHCDDVASLMRAVESPLTADQFISNVWNSWRFTQLRIDRDPVAARTELC